MVLDRYTRALLTAIAISTTVLAARAVLDGFPVAQAQTAPLKRCIWTYIVDAYKPDVGRDGEVALKGKNWQRVSAEGWKMVAAVPGGYFFERCD
jgi:hypothetical protein